MDVISLKTSCWWFGTFLIFPYIGNFIIPTDELNHFSEGLGQPPTRLGFRGLDRHFIIPSPILWSQLWFHHVSSPTSTMVTPRAVKIGGKGLHRHCAMNIPLSQKISIFIPYWMSFIQFPPIKVHRTKKSYLPATDSTPHISHIDPDGFPDGFPPMDFPKGTSCSSNTTRLESLRSYANSSHRSSGPGAGVGVPWKGTRGYNGSDR